MTTHDGGTGLCRPRGDARRRALLDAAWKLFLDKGYERTTLGDIIALAGGSRSTLYEAFGDKDGLFETVIGTQCEEFLDRLRQVPLSDADPEVALTGFATRFAEELFSDVSPKLMRLMIASGDQFPRVRDAFIDGVPRAVRAILAEYLREADGRGQLHVKDPEAAASAFVALLQGERFIRILLHPADLPGPDEIRRHVADVVRIFLDGVR
ncbi:TetR/AcrR family transcriptional regulator [Arenibaculum pallidiluteum]|uniref:TetR/AcrR family transcriptional regulator n=1 Tax=Arenibaculum pallidiluteum TaxID=2812559 RepID=UPI001A96E800|nr:TetR/AcrR family transcriptional regulator [Arenibaculum pallidiluteum]